MSQEDPLQHALATKYVQAPASDFLVLLAGRLPGSERGKAAEYALQENFYYSFISISLALCTWSSLISVIALLSAQLRSADP